MLVILLFMMRLVRPLVVCLIFAIGCVVGASFASYNQDAATALLLMRADMLVSAEQQLSAKNVESADSGQPQHVQAQSAEAIKALRALYAQEEQLWTYYAALQESASVRATLESAKQQASTQIAEQAGELARIDALVERLRPSQPSTFSIHRALAYGQGLSSPSPLNKKIQEIIMNYFKPLCYTGAALGALAVASFVVSNTYVRTGAHPTGEQLRSAVPLTLKSNASICWSTIWMPPSPPSAAGW